MLKQFFYDPRTGFLDADKLYRKLKPINNDITLKQVKDFVDKQFTYQVNKRQMKPQKYNTITADYPRQKYQMDIIVYSRYKMNNYQYILMVIDVYSRYLSARPMTNRQNTTIMNNMKDIFNEMGIPEQLSCDNEFDTKQFENYCESNNIDVTFTDPYEINKNAIVERANGTITRMLQKVRVGLGNNKWYKYLNDVVYNYNHTFHKGIKAIPFNVMNGLDTNNQTIIRVKQDIKTGDLVRIKVKREIFDKGDMEAYSREVYRVVGKNRGKYRLSDIEDDEELEQLYKPYEIKRINEIIERPMNDEEQVREIQKKRERTKKKRDLRRVGISKSNIGTEKRVRRATKQNEDYDYSVDDL